MQITRRYEIDAGHRVPDHASQCKNLHGHRYVIEATVEGKLVDAGQETGMVMDFGFLKEAMAKLFDRADHAMILHREDPVALVLGYLQQQVLTGFPHVTQGNHGRLYIIDRVPTAENLAEIWAGQLSAELARRGVGLRLARLRVYETPNCYADWVSP